MHITLESDYAVRIVHALTVANTRMDARTIAEETGVSMRFSLKILRKLVQSDIVRSYKGTHGGYQLNRDPQDISLADVIGAVEGVYSFSRCLSPDFECNCSKECECSFQKIYDEISEMVRDKLESVKFSDI